MIWTTKRTEAERKPRKPGRYAPYANRQLEAKARTMARAIERERASESEGR